MPSLSVEQIDRRIRDHERQIAELRSLRAGILKFSESANGAHHAPAVKRVQPLAPNTTGLKAAIVGLNLPPRFSLEDVMQGLNGRGFDFAGRNPRHAVRDSLYVLVKKKRGFRRAGQSASGHVMYEKISP